MGRGITQTFFQRRYTSGQWAHEKVLNTTGYQENVNENHTKKSFHTNRFTEEPGRLQSTGSQRVGHDFTSLQTSIYW